MHTPAVCLSLCRHEFDSEQIPDLTRDVFRQDIHSVCSLCKLYFRELPNPLLTYQLYDKFAVSNSFHLFSETVAMTSKSPQQCNPLHTGCPIMDLPTVHKV